MNFAVVVGLEVSEEIHFRALPLSARSSLRDGSSELIYAKTRRDQSKEYENALFLALTATRCGGLPSSVRRSSSRLTSGKRVLVSTASIMRPPLSVSVQRLTTRSTTAWS